MMMMMMKYVFPPIVLTGIEIHPDIYPIDMGALFP